MAEPQERCLCGKTITDPPPPATNIIQSLRRKKTPKNTHTHTVFYNLDNSSDKPAIASDEKRPSVYIEA